MTGTDFRAQLLWRRSTQREARLQRRNAAGAASVQTDKKHLPQSVQIRRQSSASPPPPPPRLSGFYLLCKHSCGSRAAAAVGSRSQASALRRRCSLIAAPKRRTEAYVCLNEGRGLISGCRGRPSLFHDHTRSGQAQIKGIVF